MTGLEPPTSGFRSSLFAKVAFTLGQNPPRKMAILLVKKTFFIYQMAKSTAYYALCERALIEAQPLT